jgi:hypothetical protein
MLEQVMDREVKLKQLRAHRIELRKDLHGRCSKDSKGRVLSKKEVSRLMAQARRELRCVDRQILVLETEKKRDEHKMISEIKTQIAACEASGEIMRAPALKARLDEQPISRDRKFRFWRAFFGERSGKPKPGNMKTIPKADGNVYKEVVPERPDHRRLQLVAAT